MSLSFFTEKKDGFFVCVGLNHDFSKIYKISKIMRNLDNSANLAKIVVQDSYCFRAPTQTILKFNNKKNNKLHLKSPFS